MLDWLYEIVAQIIMWIHSGLSTVVDENSGWAWGGSIFLLTVLMRLLIFPLFVKQIHASRKMQELNPQVQALRKKYKNDKQRMNQEVMKLYQDAGANPLAGCLPLLVQMPIFIGLFQVLNGISKAGPNESKYGIPAELIQSAQHADILGAVIPDTFLNAWSADPRSISALVVTGIAVIISSTTTFFTIRSSMKRQPVMDENNPMVAAQKMMVVMAPLFGLFGLGFPLGVLMYWVTSNTWSLAQQNYIYRKYPVTTPGEQNGQGKGTGKTTAAKGKGSGTKTLDTKAKGKNEPAAEPKEKVVRQQPVRKSRSKRSGSPKR
ncbi:membrane protein insertase YidC [Actinomadura craniellae]|uniref:Membrane protein insertase YidC n=1 Tax=Actinomadura craniellae TaxID=2231787 RepID=A0A365H6G0_9ACTN|nr:membrane protein insertase YidC [Actinomadura craniellae]RAY14704.1 membrane protein insertase YidC [Actinomadura craniellae]